MNRVDAAAENAVAPAAFEQIAEQLLSQFGWSGSQFSCLQPLWERESGRPVANAIVWLASDYASYLTGEVVSVSSQHA